MTNHALDDYPSLLGDIKGRIQGAQVRAALAASRELLRLYWDVGRLIAARQEREGWGAGVIPRLARDLASDLPGVSGFSERNLKRMIRFFREYPHLGEKVPPAVALLGDGPNDPFFKLPWTHHVVLMEKVKDATTRRWYVENAVAEGWSRDVLATMIKSEAHQRQGAAITNFSSSLPEPQSDLARGALKDPYVFDFLTLEAPFRERELEAHLLTHLERFLLELGVGFAFVGRQYHLALDGEDFYLDLLFYHLKLRCYVVVELKVGAFEAEYAGKMNLYLNLVDDQLRHPDDQPSIGLILCQDKKRLLAEYALRGLDKPIGVSEYELTRALPAELESSLPSIEAIEAELARDE